jgi:hypothetical protein
MSASAVIVGIKGAVEATRPSVIIDPSDLLTADELASRLKLPKSWVFEQTRERAKVRCKSPLPHIHLGKYLRFSWPQVCEWMQNGG